MKQSNRIPSLTMKLQWAICALVLFSLPWLKSGLKYNLNYVITYLIEGFKLCCYIIHEITCIHSSFDTVFGNSYAGNFYAVSFDMKQHIFSWLVIFLITSMAQDHYHRLIRMLMTLTSIQHVTNWYLNPIKSMTSSPKKSYDDINEFLSSFHV